MKNTLAELGIILGGLFITGCLASASGTLSGPGSGFLPALIMAGGAGLLTLIHLSFSGRLLCVSFLIFSLFYAKSEWDADEQAEKLARKLIVENLQEQFKLERRH